MTSFARVQAGAAESPDSLRELIREGRVVFGCARLHHLRSGAQRERLLHAAIDGGIRHFDVAPSYGNGSGERALGRVLRSGGRDVAVNTKAGIPVWVYPAIGDPVLPILRGIDRVLGTHRRAYATRDFRPTTLKQSLERSLHRLRLSRVDTFFLHEPIATFTSNEWNDIVETMVRLRDAGKIRAWGIAGPSRRYDLGSLQSNVALTVQQPFDDLEQVKPPTFVERRLAYSTFSAFRAANTSVAFGAFLAQSARRYPDARFIVSTTGLARLEGWLSRGQP